VEHQKTTFTASTNEHPKNLGLRFERPQHMFDSGMPGYKTGFMQTIDSLAAQNPHRNDAAKTL